MISVENLLNCLKNVKLIIYYGNGVIKPEILLDLFVRDV